MKYIHILIAMIAFMPTLAVAQSFLEPVETIQKKEYVSKYFDRCMEEPDKNQSYDSQSDMCMCQAVYMGEHLTADEIKIMATGVGKGYVRKDVLYQEVYAPCLEYPAKEMAREQCYNDRQVIALVSTQNAYEGTCNCVTQKAVDYFRELAKPQLSALMKLNPILVDPLGAIMSSFEFTTHTQKANSSCLAIYQVKWDDYYRTRKLKERQK